MKTVRCRRCKSEFEVTTTLGSVCPACLAREEEQYFAVRAYVKQHPGVTVTEVSSKMNISTTRVLKYLKQEKLELSNHSTSMNILKCQSCGTNISTGTLCENCKRATPSLNKAPDPNQKNYVEAYRKSYSNKMYSANKNKK